MPPTSVGTSDARSLVSTVVAAGVAASVAAVVDAGVAAASVVAGVVAVVAAGLAAAGEDAPTVADADVPEGVVVTPPPAHATRTAPSTGRTRNRRLSGLATAAPR